MPDPTDETQGKNSASTGAPVRGGDPSADDPFFAGAPPRSGGAEPEPLDEREKEAIEMAKHDPEGEKGPSYERNQGVVDSPAGGSTDPHNTLSHADSGDETE
jgi:hypothetical protein